MASRQAAASGAFAGLLLIGGAALMYGTVTSAQQGSPAPVLPAAPGGIVDPQPGASPDPAVAGLGSNAASITVTPTPPAAGGPEPAPLPEPPAGPPETPAAGTGGLAPAPQAMAEGRKPLQWPDDLPLPADMSVQSVDFNGQQRYLLVKKSSVQLLGGEMIKSLKRNGWDVTSVATPRSGTIVARLGQQSVAVVIRDNPDGLDASWVSMDVTYQASPPPSPSPSPSQDLEKARA